MESEKLFELLKERNELLRKRPEYKELQAAIDAALLKAGTNLRDPKVQINRNVIIQKMMFESLNKLNERLQKLTAITQDLFNDNKDLDG